MQGLCSCAEQGGGIAYVALEIRIKYFFRIISGYEVFVVTGNRD